MASFFKKLFGKSSNEESRPAANSSYGFPSSYQGGSESVARAHLVQDVMRELLRKSGIPPDWIICQPQVLNSKSRGPGIFVRLAVRHWDDRLMQYAFAFQKALLTDIVRFEPKASSWLHGIAWQLEVASTCPHTVLPDRDFWLQSPESPRVRPATTPRQPLVTPVTAAAPAAAQQSWAAQISPFSSKPPASTLNPEPLNPELSAAENDIKQDLERFFAVRDEELARSAAKGGVPDGYESTQPAPLQGH
jgi:hypothetical protein